MALPILSGTATIFPAGKAERITLEQTKSGTPMAKFNAAFQKAVKDDYGQWQVKAKINVRVTAFGPLAEYVAHNYNPKDKADLQIETELTEFTGDDGTEVKMVSGVLRSAGAPFAPKGQSYASSNGGGYSNGGGEYG